MTYFDIAVKVLHEITLEPIDKIEPIIKIAIERAGLHSALTDDLGYEDASRILEHLRSDPSSVLSLYAAGKGEFPRRSR